MLGKRDITSEQRVTVVEEYLKTGSVNRAAEAAGMYWDKATRILEEAGLYPPIAASEPADGSEQMVEAEQDQTAVEPEHDAADEPQPTVSARQILQTDFEEAQKAMVLLDTIKQVYGDAPNLELAVIEEYKCRRAA